MRTWQPPALKSLKDACDAAQSYAQKPRGWLLLTGDYGSGKTHLAAAIANFRAKLGDPPLFVMVSDLLDHLRATFGSNSETTFDRRFDEIRTAPLLVLDDLGAQSMTPWVREKLHQLFDYRYNAELPTVITWRRTRSMTWIPAFDRACWMRGCAASSASRPRPITASQQDAKRILPGKHILAISEK